MKNIIDPQKSIPYFVLIMYDDKKEGKRMITASQVLEAQEDANLREALLEASLQDICRYGAKAAGRWIDRHDDLYSESLIAFNDAITAYDPSKGPFPTFAAKVIRNRVTDQLRKRRDTLFFSDLEQTDDRGEPIPFTIPDHREQELSMEILSLQQELKAFGISFYDLPAASPKAGRTRRGCVAVVRQISRDAALLDQLLTTGRLPATELLSRVSVSRKLLERHRAYIIAGTLICCGDYTGLLAYFMGGERP